MGALQEEPWNLTVGFWWNVSLISEMCARAKPGAGKADEAGSSAVRCMFSNPSLLPGLRMLFTCDSSHRALRVPGHSPTREDWCITTPGLLPLLSSLTGLGAAPPEANWPSDLGTDIFMGSVCFCADISDCNWFCCIAGFKGPSLASAVNFREPQSSP